VTARTTLALVDTKGPYQSIVEQRIQRLIETFSVGH
jgi:hypothetical protein